MVKNGFTKTAQALHQLKGIEKWLQNDCTSFALIMRGRKGGSSETAHALHRTKEDKSSCINTAQALHRLSWLH